MHENEVQILMGAALEWERGPGRLTTLGFAVAAALSSLSS
jgi:hypothetical protein